MSDMNRPAERPPTPWAVTALYKALVSTDSPGHLRTFSPEEICRMARIIAAEAPPCTDALDAALYENMKQERREAEETLERINDIASHGGAIHAWLNMGAIALTAEAALKKLRGQP